LHAEFLQVLGVARLSTLARLTKRTAGRDRPCGVLPVSPRATDTRPLTSVAFDVLVHGEPAIDEPYCQRRALLDGLQLHGDTWCTVPLHGSVVDVLAACAEHDVEGIVAKRVDSPYRLGQRLADWLKLKTADWRASHAPLRHEQ
jgi:ATP-dependent DNA ligase